MTIVNTLKGRSVGADASVGNAAVVTPSDTVDLATATRGLYLSATGTVKVTLYPSGTVVTYPGLVGGVTHAKRVSRVWATGTDAGLTIIAEW
jgi:hypothetical protein